MADIGVVDEIIAQLRSAAADLEKERMYDLSPYHAPTQAAIEHIQKAIQSLEVILDADMAGL